jgi:hypothetical protein
LLSLASEGGPHEEMDVRSGAEPLFVLRPPLLVFFAAIRCLFCRHPLLLFFFAVILNASEGSRHPTHRYTAHTFPPRSPQFSPSATSRYPPAQRHAPVGDRQRIRRQRLATTMLPPHKKYADLLPPTLIMRQEFKSSRKILPGACPETKPSACNTLRAPFGLNTLRRTPGCIKGFQQSAPGHPIARRTHVLLHPAPHQVPL